MLMLSARYEQLTDPDAIRCIKSLTKHMLVFSNHFSIQIQIMPQVDKEQDDNIHSVRK